MTWLALVVLLSSSKAEVERGKAAVAAPQMAVIPGGCFTFGAKAGASRQWKVVAPPYRRCLPSYLIDIKEASAADYRACVKAGACPPPAAVHPVCPESQPNPGALPAGCLDWKRAQAFCRWQGKRLPTDSEWERAARGKQLTTYPWGEKKPTPALAVVHDHERPEEGPAASCSRPAGNSPEGLCDIAGNVEEWVSDWWKTADGLPSEPRGVDPDKAGLRVSRGSSYAFSRTDLKGIMRNFQPSALEVYLGVGVRCAKDASR